MSTTYTMRISESEKAIISEYSKAQGVSMAEFMIGCAMEAIEDAIDVIDADEAYLDYLANPKTIPLKDIMDEEGLL